MTGFGTNVLGFGSGGGPSTYTITYLVIAGGAGGGAFTGAGPMIGPNIQTTFSPTEQAISTGAFTDAQTLLGNVVGSLYPRASDI